jgi:hypothetical protein
MAYLSINGVSVSALYGSNMYHLEHSRKRSEQKADSLGWSSWCLGHMSCTRSLSSMRRTHSMVFVEHVSAMIVAV